MLKSFLKSILVLLFTLFISLNSSFIVYAEKENVNVERKVEFAKKHSERISKHFKDYYERLNKIILKIEKKVSGNKLAENKLDEAKATLEEAKTLGNEAVNLFANINTGNLGSNTDTIKNAKEKAEAARKGFMNATKQIREAFKLTKSNEKR